LTRYTQVFEDMVRTFFGDFLELVEPGLVARLGAEAVIFRHRDELAHWPEEERRDLGLLAEILTCHGEWRTILVQVEAEAGDPARLEEKLLGWYLRLAVEDRQPVRVIAVHLRGGEPGLSRRWIVDEVDGEELLRIPYLAFGLEECRAEDFLAKPQPLAWALASLMRPTRRSRAAHTRACLRRIAGWAAGELTAR
jgi:hypothetical protein